MIHLAPYTAQKSKQTVSFSLTLLHRTRLLYTRSRADQFELTIVLPPSPLASKENGTPSTIAIVLPVGSRELVRDLKNVVSESAEGFWLGAFSLARADEEEAAPMGDWDEIGTAFEAEQYSDPTHPRAIKVIDGQSRPFPYVLPLDQRLDLHSSLGEFELTSHRSQLPSTRLKPVHTSCASGK